MTKARTLGNFVSAGNPLADGDIDYSDLVGTPTLPSGDIVGTTDSQTLTNKTISAANNTLVGVASTGKAIAMAIVFGG